MRRLLQAVGFKFNRYDRPNRKWVCGNQGIPCQECPNGPKADGRCGGKAQCKPVKRGDRYQCMRLPSLGGACEEGPLPDGSCCHQITPCEPVRTLRSHRARACAFLGALSVAFVMATLLGSRHDQITNPGDLTSAHAISAMACQDCHATADSEAAEVASWADFSHHALAVSQNCLNCHQVSSDDHPMSPHSINPNELARLANDVRTSPVFSGAGFFTDQSALLLAKLNNGEKQLACSACHQEHHGRNADLKAMSNAQCQTCHTTRFNSFANGHPDFNNYPFTRRTQIIFDHNTHINEHFSNGRVADLAPQSCQDCHETDRQGELMVTGSFEQTCAACHSGDIRKDTHPPGLRMFSWPELDAESLRKRGHGVGDWPTYADGRITPFMRLLWENNPEVMQTLANFEGKKLWPLDEADDETLQSASEVAWAVKGLLYEMIHEGQERLASPNEFMNDPRLVGGLSQDTLLLAQAEWAPKLENEVVAFRQGTWQPSTDEEEPPPTPDPAPDSLDGALLNDAGSDDLLGGGIDGEVDLLADAGDSDNMDLLLSGTSDDTDLLGGGATEEPETIQASGKVYDRLTDAQEFALHGGWYRSGYNIYYGPVGHADPVLEAWLDLTAERAGEDLISREIFETLSAEHAPGRCIKCHSVDETPGGNFKINWRGERPEPHHHPFTKFSHAAHFSLMNDRGCQSCHTMDRSNNYASSFVDNHDPHKFISNFQPINRSLCADCHTEEVAGNSCLQCHSYHIGDFRPVMLDEWLSGVRANGQSDSVGAQP